MAHDAALRRLHSDARDIFLSALDACRIDRVLPQRVACDGHELRISPPAWSGNGPDQALRIPLGQFRSLLLIAMGKAAVPLTDGLLRILPETLPVRGLCVAPERPDGPRLRNGNRRIGWFAGGHPVPNRNSFRAARAALWLLEQADEHTLVLFLISGGGSSLFELPLDPAITLADTIAFHRALVASGATIAEMNTLRKHFSAVKGGRLALAACDAAKLTLSVLDVPLSQLDALASGPTVGDSTTVEDCRELLTRYRLSEQFPAAVRAFFARSDLPETPGVKGREANEGSTSPFGVHWNVPLLANEDLLAAARHRATAHGYEVVIDNACDDWPYEQAARYLTDRFLALRREQPGRKLCLLSGGEVTVAIKRQPGTGGRNQQFALAAALLLDRECKGQSVVCLSAGSDSIDGSSPAAGAIVDPNTVTQARPSGREAEQALAQFDAHPLLESVEATVQISVTRNNLRDLRVYLSVPTPI